MKNKVKIIFVTIVVLALVGFDRTTIATTEEVVDDAFFFVTMRHKSKGIGQPTMGEYMR